MRDNWIRNISLAIAIFSGSIAIFDIFFDRLVSRLIFPLTVAASANAALLFILIMSRKYYRDGIDNANAKMSDGKLFGPSIKGDDEHWGFFGKNTGGPMLQWVRLVFFTGVIPFAIINSFVGGNIMPLWMAGGFITVFLSHMAIADAEY